MAGSKKKSGLLLDLEAANGTAVTPTAAANAVAIRAKGLKIKSSVDTAARDVITGVMGNDDKLPFSHTADLSFGVELAGSGTAGTAPAWGKIMQMGGFAETVVAAATGVTARVEYAPIQTGFKSATVFAEQNDRLERYYYLMAALKMGFVVGEIPSLDVAAKGLVTSVAAGSLGTKTFTPWRRSLAVGAINTSKMSLGFGGLRQRCLERWHGVRLQVLQPGLWPGRPDPAAGLSPDGWHLRLQAQGRAGGRPHAGAARPVRG